MLDPLCPACRAFESRYVGSAGHAQISRQALLFPLDNQCNWMLDSAVHPGACAVSEALAAPAPGMGFIPVSKPGAVPQPVRHDSDPAQN